MKEILVTAYTDPETKRPMATIVRVDREAGTYEALMHNGEWRPTSLWHQDNEGFKLANATVRGQEQPA